MEIRETYEQVEPNCTAVAQIIADSSVFMSLYHNTDIDKTLNSKTLVFGLPSGSEAIRSSAWVQQMEQFAKGGGYGKIIGPINANTWNDYRFCTDVFEKKFFTDISNDPVYNQHLLENGFKSGWEYVSGQQRSHGVRIPFITNRDFFESQLEIIEIDPTRLHEYLPALYPVVSEIFSENALFSNISEAGFINKYSQLKPVLKTGDLFLAKHENSVVGFGLTLDDLLNTEEKGMVVKTIGRVKNRAYTGVGAWISEIIYKKYVANNYDYMVHAFMYTGNNSLKISRRYQGEIIKHYAVYEKNI